HIHVAVVERCGFHAQQHLARTGTRLGARGEPQMVEVPFVLDDPCSHGSSLQVLPPLQGEGGGGDGVLRSLAALGMTLRCCAQAITACSRDARANTVPAAATPSSRAVPCRPGSSSPRHSSCRWRTPRCRSDLTATTSFHRRSRCPCRDCRRPES